MLDLYTMEKKLRLQVTYSEAGIADPLWGDSEGIEKAKHVVPGSLDGFIGFHRESSLGKQICKNISRKALNQRQYLPGDAACSWVE